MLILTSTKPASKEEFNKLIRLHNNGSDEVREQTLYNIGYQVYCSNLIANKSNHTLKERANQALADMMIKASEAQKEAKQAQARISELIDEIDTLNSDFDGVAEYRDQIKAENAKLREQNEALQRAIRLHYVGKLSKEELIEIAMQNNPNIKFKEENKQ